MIAHVSLYVKDYKKAKKLYEAALKPLGYKLKMDMPQWKAAGFMEGGHTSFWIIKRPHGDKLHVAFLAKSKKIVHAFHVAALKAGARDHGKPGPRKQYSRDYYAAFVLDKEGNNIEVVYFDKLAR